MLIRSVEILTPDEATLIRARELADCAIVCARTSDGADWGALAQLQSFAAQLAMTLAGTRYAARARAIQRALSARESGIELAQTFVNANALLEVLELELSGAP